LDPRASRVLQPEELAAHALRRIVSESRHFKSSEACGTGTCRHLDLGFERLTLPPGRDGELVVRGVVQLERRFLPSGYVWPAVQARHVLLSPEPG
jgi:hypothetical protein